MLLRNLSKFSPIGVDLGSTTSRAAQLTRSGQKWIVSSAVLCEAEGAEKNGPAHLHVGRIGRLASRSAFNGRSACVALSSPEAHFHLLELPSSALNTAASGGTRASPIVQNEMERLTAGAVAPAEARHWTLPSAGPNSPNAVGVAVARPVAERIVRSAEKSGVRCDRLTTAPTALVALARHLREWSTEQIWGLLDIGLRESRLILCVDHMPVLIRRAGAGGHIMTERVAHGLGLSAKAAEVHKCEHGIAAPASRKMRDEAHRSELPSLIIGALRGELTEIAGEIKRSYEYVLRCYPGKAAADLVLTGSGGLMHNLPEFLSQSLGIPVQRASSYLGGGECRVGVQAGVRAPLEVFSVAIGAALEGVRAV